MSFIGKLGNFTGGLEFNYALGSDGTLGYNLFTPAYGPYFKVGVGVTASSSIEKAFGATPREHITGHQMVINTGGDIGIITAGINNGDLYDGIPYAPSSTKLFETTGYYGSFDLSVELPSPIDASISYQYGIERSYNEVDLGVLGKGLYALRNTIWF